MISALGIMRIVSRATWRVNPELTLPVYRNLILAILEWGTPLFADAAGSVLLTQNSSIYGDQIGLGLYKLHSNGRPAGESM